jgi:phosphate-selective porin OprO/OprP
VAPAAARPPEDLERRVRDLEALVRQLQSGRPAGGAGGAPDAPPKGGTQAPEKEDAKSKQTDKAEADPKGDAGKKADPAKDATPAAGRDFSLKASWKDGFFAETADKDFTFHIGGRWDFDSTWYGAPHAVGNSIGQFNNFADPNLGLTDGVALRRARLRMDGTLYEVMEYAVEYEFANFIDLRRRTLGAGPSSVGTGSTGNDFDPATPVRFTDVYAGFKDLPLVGTVKVGHQKEFLTMANATSARYMTFMERPMVFEAFNGDFQFASGVSAQQLYLDGRLLVWAGVFRNNNVLTNANNNGAFDWQDGDYAYDVRVTGLPVWEGDGDGYVHLGAAYSYRNLHMDRTRFRAFPLVRSGTAFQVPSVVNTGILFSRDAEQIFNLEFATALGPWTVTAEWSGAWVPGAYSGGLPEPGGRLPPGVTPRGTFFANGAYAEVLYFLTRDHRPYRKEQGAYDRIRPAEDFALARGPCRYPVGWGAWEVGLRYDFLDLAGGGVNGGVSHGLTAGVNWHLNPNMRVMLNYVYQTRAFSPTNFTDRQDGGFNGLGARMHWDF